MNDYQTIVSYRQIEKACRGNFDAIHRAGEEGLESIPRSTPQIKAAALAQLSHALHELEREQQRGGVMVAVQDQLGSLWQTFLAERSAEAGKLEPVEGGALEAKFDSNDIFGWMGSFFTWWKRIRPHKFLTADPDPEPLANTLRAGLVSDWGTGLYGAPVCADSIKRDAKGYQLLIHLGDVYYSGDKGEINNRFLKFWPQVSGATNRALNANHEMYTGGKAYYKIALPAFGQKASYWAMQNDFWILAGLDSAHKDHDLKGNQVEWLENILANAGNRRLILFSHHQPFSLLDKQGPNLVSKLGSLLDQRRIFAWYWGHEHRCVLYDPHPLWALQGRCIGHGGYPYFRKETDGPAPAQPEWKRLPGKNFVPGGLLLDGRNPYIPGHETEYGPHGYLTLEFEDHRLNEIVHDADGTVLREVPLS